MQVIQVSKEREPERWAEVRSTGIGGSDAAAIYGKGYTSPYALWALKAGLVDRIHEENPAMRWGEKLERPVAEMFAEDYQCAVVWWPVILRDEAHPVMLASVDFWVVEPSREFPVGVVTDFEGSEMPRGIVCILEIKTTGVAAYGNASDWDDEGVPEQYEIQGLHYAATTGVLRVVFAALVAGDGLQVRPREYDEEMCLNHIQRVQEFWRRVETGESPDPDGSPSTLATIKRLFPRSRESVIVEADDFLVDTFERWVKAKDFLAQHEAVVEGLRGKLILACGEAEEVVYRGRTLFTYRNNKDGTKFDVERFKAELPQLYARFQLPVPGARVLRPR